MTDSEKLDMILSKMQSMDDRMQNIESRMDNMDDKMQNMENRMDNLESQVKQTERVLKDEIQKECGLVLDEVERVHYILDKHKSDKSVHTA